MGFDVIEVNPEYKRVVLPVRGPHFDIMCQKALLEAAAFLKMDVDELSILNASPAKVVQMTRFVSDLSCERFPVEWEMTVTVGVFVPDPDDD